MIRIVAVEVDAGAAANVGGPVHTRYRTFDFDLPELEAFLLASQAFAERSVAGVELIPTQPKDTDHA